MENEPRSSAAVMTSKTSMMAALIFTTAVVFGACNSSSSGNDDPTTLTTLASSSETSTSSTDSSRSPASVAGSEGAAGSDGAAGTDGEQQTASSAEAIGASATPPISVVLTASGLEPLGDEGFYILVSYSGDQWQSGGSFDFEGSSGSFVLEGGTTELVIHPEFSNVAVLIGADPGETDQLAEKYVVASGSIDAGQRIDLTDVSGKGLVVISLGLPT